VPAIIQRLIALGATKAAFAQINSQQSCFNVTLPCVQITWKSHNSPGLLRKKD
jgi:hypothetical protein